MQFRYPSGMVVTFERDAHDNLRAVDFELGPRGGTSAHPVGIIQSPATRRALASQLPPADYTGQIATVNR